MKLKPRADYLFNWESVIAIIGFVGLLLVAVLVYRNLLDQPLGPVPINQGGQVVSRSGVEGFKVDELVCQQFAIERKAAPDVGWSYELTRNVGGVVELVQINTDFDDKVINKDFNRHFVNTTSGQAPEPAYVTAEGLKCIQVKAK